MGIIPDEFKDDITNGILEAGRVGKKFIVEFVDLIKGGEKPDLSNQYQEKYILDRTTKNGVKIINDEMHLISSNASNTQMWIKEALDADFIRYIVENGKRYAILKENNPAIIRNNLNNIAPESFVTSHIFIHPGEKLQLGNGKDYYTIKEHDTIAAIAKANGIKVKELAALNPWLADENRMIFYRDKLIMPEGVSLIIDTHTNHQYGDEETRAVVAIAQNGSSSEKSSTRHLTSNINHPLSISDTSAHDYFADFDGGNDKFYGSLKGGDTFAGGKGNDIYYINFNGEKSDTIIDSEGKTSCM